MQNSSVLYAKSAVVIFYIDVHAVVAKNTILVPLTISLCMKKLANIILVLSVALFAVSCGNNSQKRIASETPIKTEVLGLKLCGVTSESKVERALAKATDKEFLTTTEKDGGVTAIRAYSIGWGGVNTFNYGTLSWHYADILINDKNKIVEIKLTASYENIDRAKEQFDAATAVLSKKYGKGNLHGETCNNFWTDNVNTVGLVYQEGSTINGNDRSFCTMYYINIALAEELERQTPDV